MIKYEYKVMSFYNDEHRMENSLNKLAEEGWRLVNTCLQHPDSSKSTIIVILEKVK